jgi:methylenetetrahydrofolate reductase (NADPH)
MNEGRYLDQNIQNGERTDFCIGIAGYPEKHFESPNMSTDLLYTKMKVDAGADYIVTQMFFDNTRFFDFVTQCRNAGINVPIVPGLKPLTKSYQLNSIPRKFFVNMPDDFVKEVMKAKDDEAVKQVGVAWCIQQSKELKAAGVPCIHYYTMGDTDTTRAIVSGI